MQDVNTSSLTSAIGFSGVFSALGGKDTKIAPTDILPFPEATGETKRRMSERTAKIVKRLYKQGAVPPLLLGAIADLLEEAVN